MEAMRNEYTISIAIIEGDSMKDLGIYERIT
jgi:hypothetical protein